MFSLHALQKNVNVIFFLHFSFFQMKQQLVINMLAFFFFFNSMAPQVSQSVLKCRSYVLSVFYSLVVFSLSGHSPVKMQLIGNLQN